MAFSGASALKVLRPTVLGIRDSLRKRSSIDRTKDSCSAVAVAPTLTKMSFSSIARHNALIRAQRCPLRRSFANVGNMDIFDMVSSVFDRQLGR